MRYHAPPSVIQSMREVVRYTHITASVLLLQKTGISAIKKGKIFGTSFVISFYQETVKGTLSAN